MSKTLLALIFVLLFVLLTNTALERFVSDSAWKIGRGAAAELQYFAKDAGTGVMGGVETLRRALAYETTYYKNIFKQNIDSGRDTSFLAYVPYFFFLFLSLFFVYSVLYYALWILFIIWLFIIIRNRF